MMLAGVPFAFRGMGLFETDADWIHPDRVETTWELILVRAGDVFLENDGTRYALKKGNLILLPPGVRHFGYAESHGRTSFYWLHFTAPSLPFPLPTFMDHGAEDDLFRRLLHVSLLPGRPEDAAESILAYLLLSLSEEYGLNEKRTRLCHEVVEWIRINATAELRASDCARHFGYSPEHLCRLLQKETGTGTRELISGMLLARAKALLLNSPASCKEIAAELGFSSENAFLHFFRYHEKQAPVTYRNRYALTHMNKK